MSMLNILLANKMFYFAKVGFSKIHEEGTSAKFSNQIIKRKIGKCGTKEVFFKEKNHKYFIFERENTGFCNTYLVKVMKVWISTTKLYFHSNGTDIRSFFVTPI